MVAETPNPSTRTVTRSGYESGAESINAERPPNIIFIMTDDLGYGDLGSYGQQIIPTPRLDQMAEQGMRFTQFYAGHTVCAPSRSSLMTGQHTGHTRVRGNRSRTTGDRIPLEPQDTTIAQVLQQAGYSTGLVGKWGLGEAGSQAVPNLKGFDYFWGFLNQQRAHTYYPEWVWRNDTRVLLVDVDDDAQGIEVRTGFKRADHNRYSHDLDMDESMQFVRANQHRPFFLYMALQIPHAEMAVPDDSLQEFLDEEGNSLFDERPFPHGQSRTYAGNDMPFATFAAMISRLDRDIGRLLDLLARLEIDEHTLVLFTSDNGTHSEGGFDPQVFASSGPLRGQKRDLYEGGIRVPMIARMPGTVPAGVVSDQVWAKWDFFPTAVELAGARLPEQHMDGISMVPTLIGGVQQEQHEVLYWEFHEGVFRQAVRFGDWKAVRVNADQPVELYNLATDIGEQHDLAEQHPEVVDRARRYMRTLRTESEHWPAPQNMNW